MARDGQLYREHHVPRVWVWGWTEANPRVTWESAIFPRRLQPACVCMGWGVPKEGEKEREREADATFSGRNLEVVLENHEPSMVTSAWMKLSGVAAHRSR